MLLITISIVPNWCNVPWFNVSIPSTCKIKYSASIHTHQEQHLTPTWLLKGFTNSSESRGRVCGLTQVELQVLHPVPLPEHGFRLYHLIHCMQVEMP